MLLVLNSFITIHYNILEQILVLILDHTWPTADRIGADLFFVDRHWSVYSVGNVSPLTLARRHQRGWLLYIMNLIST